MRQHSKMGPNVVYNKKFTVSCCEELKDHCWTFYWLIFAFIFTLFCYKSCDIASQTQLPTCDPLVNGAPSCVECLIPIPPSV